jgi:hypothetical protein
MKVQRDKAPYINCVTTWRWVVSLSLCITTPPPQKKKTSADVSDAVTSDQLKNHNVSTKNCTMIIQIRFNHFTDYMSLAHAHTDLKFYMIHF